MDAKSKFPIWCSMNTLWSPFSMGFGRDNTGWMDEVSHKKGAFL